MLSPSYGINTKKSVSNVINDCNCKAIFYFSSRQATISNYDPNKHYKLGSFESWAQRNRLLGYDPYNFGGGDLGYGVVPGLYQGFAEAPGIVIPELLIAKLRYAIWGAELLPFAINGETSATKLGKMMHLAYKTGEEDKIQLFKEYHY